MRRMLGQKVRSTPHNAIRHDGRLITPFYGVTSWPCDELAGSHFSLPRNFPDWQRGWTQEPAKVENVVQIAICGSFSPYRGDSIQRLRWHLARNILGAVTFLSVMLNLALAGKDVVDTGAPRFKIFINLHFWQFLGLQDEYFVPSCPSRILPSLFLPSPFSPSLLIFSPLSSVSPFHTLFFPSCYIHCPQWLSIPVSSPSLFSVFSPYLPFLPFHLSHPLPKFRICDIWSYCHTAGPAAIGLLLTVFMLILFCIFTDVCNTIVSGMSVWQSIKSEDDITTWDWRCLSQASSWQLPLEVKFLVSIALTVAFSS